MFKWGLYFLRLCTLKAHPDQAPPSRIVLYSSVLSYWALAAIFTSLSQPVLQSFFLALVETALLMFLTNLSLWIRQFPERATQTLTAVFGAGSILLGIAILISLNFTLGFQDPAFNGMFFTGIIFLIATVIIYGNIFKVSLSLPYFAGLGIALLFVYLSFTITWRFLKVISISQI